MAREQRKLAAILAAYVVGYSHLMRRDESGTLSYLCDRRWQRAAQSGLRYALAHLCFQPLTEAIGCDSNRLEWVEAPRCTRRSRLATGTCNRLSKFGRGILAEPFQQFAIDRTCL